MRVGKGSGSLRINSGKLKGRRLETLRGSAVRPTADRVREALFNILGSKPVGATVLDLFCGSGALGVEAISRGARQAVFVDNNIAVLAMLRKNLARCGLDSGTRVVGCDIAADLTLAAKPGITFDLIFMDPPYRGGLVQPALSLLVQSALLAPAALVVVEHAPEEMIEPLSIGLQLKDRRRYGRTCLTFLTALRPDIASAGVPC